MFIFIISKALRINTHTNTGNEHVFVPKLEEQNLQVFTSI